MRFWSSVFPPFYGGYWLLSGMPWHILDLREGERVEIVVGIQQCARSVPGSLSLL